MATAIGVELLTEEEYFELQKLGEFDTKRSRWIKTPADIRKLGGALYCTRSYGRVFVGSNGAESYYSGRAFRGSLRVRGSPTWFLEMRAKPAKIVPIEKQKLYPPDCIP